MTLQEAKLRLEDTIQRTDLAVNYTTYINQALRDVSLFHSFDEMKAEVTFVFSIGDQIKPLPSLFKETQGGRFSAISTDGSRYAVFNIQEIEKLYPTLRPSRHLLLSRIGQSQYIYLPSPATSSLTFTLRYYAYPTVLVADTDVSNMVTNYTNMIISKAAAIALQSVNDDQFQTHLTVFAGEVKQKTDEDIKISFPQPRPDKT